MIFGMALGSSCITASRCCAVRALPALLVLFMKCANGSGRASAGHFW